LGILLVGVGLTLAFLVGSGWDRLVRNILGSVGVGLLVSVVAWLLLSVAVSVLGRPKIASRSIMNPLEYLEEEPGNPTLPPLGLDDVRYGSGVRRLLTSPAGIPNHLIGWIEGDTKNEYHMTRLVVRLDKIAANLMVMRIMFRLDNACSPPAFVWATYPKEGDQSESLSTSSKLSATLSPLGAEASVERTGSFEVGFVASSGEYTEEARWEYRASEIRRISGQIEVAVITCRPVRRPRTQRKSLATVAATFVISEGTKHRVCSAQLGDRAGHLSIGY
jgi:hypothetical protein